MKYKLILLDLDGTLIDSSRIISDKVKRTINKARNKIAISMVSSRDEEEVLKYVKELNLNNYHIVEGARLIDTKGKEIWHRYLSPSKTKENPKRNKQTTKVGFFKNPPSWCLLFLLSYNLNVLSINPLHPPTFPKET